MNAMKLRCWVSEWEVRYNDCILPAENRFSRPDCDCCWSPGMVQTAGHHWSSLWSPSLARVQPPPSVGCWCGQCESSSVIDTIHSWHKGCYARGEQTHSFHLLVSYDAILSSILFPQIRVRHSLGWLWLNWTVSNTLSAMLSIQLILSSSLFWEPR